MSSKDWWEHVDKSESEAIAHLRAERDRYREALEHITRECQAMNKGPVAVMLANQALSSKEAAK